MTTKKILLWFFIITLLTIAAVMVLRLVSSQLTANQGLDANRHLTGCGNGICSIEETKTSCPQDCDELTCRDLYSTVEADCLSNGWTKTIINVDGINREILWKAPVKWTNGAIITLHGGEGVASNFCAPVPKKEKPLTSEILRGVPAAEFGELAVKQGFAVFSLNSTYNRHVDANGLPIGKRWNSLARDGEPNIDLDFIDQVITDTIPNLRPLDSSKHIFITGISNGGFMTTLAATHFSDRITAFAPVSSGDPYGMFFDMTTEKFLERKCGPGAFRDLETNLEVQQDNSCTANNYPHERIWPTIQNHIPFKQFFHQGDGGVDISCMQKTRDLLVKHGYNDTGAYLIKSNGKRTVENHFWQQEYNQPLLDFFKQYSTEFRTLTNETGPTTSCSSNQDCWCKSFTGESFVPGARIPYKCNLETNRCYECLYF